LFFFDGFGTLNISSSSSLPVSKDGFDSGLTGFFVVIFGAPNKSSSSSSSPNRGPAVILYK
jgi:hypothetical protein